MDLLLRYTPTWHPCPTHITKHGNCPWRSLMTFLIHGPLSPLFFFFFSFLVVQRAIQTASQSFVWRIVFCYAVINSLFHLRVYIQPIGLRFNRTSIFKPRSTPEYGNIIMLIRHWDCDSYTIFLLVVLTHEKQVLIAKHEKHVVCESYVLFQQAFSSTNLGTSICLLPNDIECHLVGAVLWEVNSAGDSSLLLCDSSCCMVMLSWSICGWHVG